MFIDNRWVMEASELTRRERKALERMTTLRDVYWDYDCMQVFGIMAITLPGGCLVWPVILFALVDGGSPWWGYLVMVVAVVVIALGFPHVVKYFGVRAVNKTANLRAARTAKYSYTHVQNPWCPLEAGLIDYLLRAVKGDKELLERHPGVVDAFLRDADNIRCQELVAWGKVSSGLRDKLRERLCAKAGKAAEAIRTLDEPQQLALQAEQHDRELDEAGAQLEQQINAEVERRVADDEARFLLREA